jgi:site-specific DNA-methyltransferase (adenine-specific)
MRSRFRAPDGTRRWELAEADAFDVLSELPVRSVDAVVTDPPYGIGFRREAWDGRDIRPAYDPAGTSEAEAFERWSARWASECLRVLKPGGHLLAFGAPRTVHRLAAGLEDAGLDLRDQLVWLYGSGVPKAPPARGRASTLKPAYEPILLARAPAAGTLAANEAAWGTGRLGIDEARIPSAAGQGRWPCNVALSHSDRCQPARCHNACPVGALDRTRPASPPSRFFYCPKPTRTERDMGCEALPATTVRIYGKGGVRPRRNTHPTVKPVELMRWLTRLVCPPGGVVLDPFAGSGSTGVAALIEQRRFLGVERDPGYARIARARLAHQAGALGRDQEGARVGA